MSFIRSGSNPEALYIWGDGVNANISLGHKQIFRMPIAVFHGLLEKFIRDYESHDFGLDIDEVLTYQGASLSYVKRGKNFKVRLAYDGELDGKAIQWECFMWEVTWMYIANMNEHRYEK